MTKRKMLAMIIALVMCVLLSGCSGEKTDLADLDYQPKSAGTFIVVESGSIEGTCIYQYIMYDPVTMVMYTYVDRYRNGGLTVMYNADGTKRLYSPNAEVE